MQSYQRERESGSLFGNISGWLAGTLLALGIAALFFLGLSIFSFTRDLTRAADKVPYQQDGYFYYTPSATPGAFDMSKVHSGEQIFPKSTCYLNLGFAYNLQGNQLQQISGSRQLYARITEDQSGWQHTVLISPETTFNTNSYFTTGMLDLCQVESTVNLMEQQTGLHPSTYSLSIISRVVMKAQAASGTILDTFEPTFVFKFDKTHFYLATNISQADPLHTTKQGLANISNFQVNTFPFFGLQFTVLSVRIFALLGLGLSSSGLLFIGWYIFSSMPDAEPRSARNQIREHRINAQESHLTKNELDGKEIPVFVVEEKSKPAESKPAPTETVDQKILAGKTPADEIPVFTVGEGKKQPAESAPTPKEVKEQKNAVEKNSANGIPVFTVDEVKNRPVESMSARKDIDKLEIFTEPTPSDEIESFKEENPVYLIDDGEIDFTESQSVAAERHWINPEEDSSEEMPPVRKEMLRYIFGPYKNNGADDELSGEE